jgi:hypothetical protein
VTSSLVVTEGHAWFLRRFDRVASCWSTDRHLGLTGAPLAIHAA